MDIILKYDYSEIVKCLQEWYAINARILPWRENKNPYYIWISEIMLQQTRVEAVKKYFERFIKALPKLKDLAEVSDEKLMKLWEGLGYYSRARNMKKAAVIIMNEYSGKLPKDYKLLLSLPGIGPYTAGAICSIAYGQPVPAVDGNVLRVMMRISGSFDDITKDKVKRELEEELRAVIPVEHPGDFNQAVMELGAAVCLPNGKPLCGKCPIMHLCNAFHLGIEQSIPIKSKKKHRKIEEKTVFVIQYENYYLLHKRPLEGLLAGLYEIPNIDGKLDIAAAENYLLELGFHIELIRELGDAKHIFSHVEWHMKGYHIKIRILRQEQLFKEQLFKEQLFKEQLFKEQLLKEQLFKQQLFKQEQLFLQENIMETNYLGTRLLPEGQYLWADIVKIDDSIMLPSAFAAYHPVNLE